MNEGQHQNCYNPLLLDLISGGCVGAGEDGRLVSARLLRQAPLLYIHHALALHTQQGLARPAHNQRFFFQDDAVITIVFPKFSDNFPNLFSLARFLEASWWAASTGSPFWQMRIWTILPSRAKQLGGGVSSRAVWINLSMIFNSLSQALWIKIFHEPLTLNKLKYKY